MSQLAAELSGLVEDELRAFNVERIYATDKSSTAGSIAEAARQLPMMSERRVVVVLRAEKLLKPKRKGKAGDVPDPDEGPTPDVDALEDYVKKPEPQTTLVLLASDIDRTRRLSKALLKQATIVECWGLKQSKDAKVNLWQVAKQAEQLVRQAVSRSAASPAASSSLPQSGHDLRSPLASIDAGTSPRSCPRSWRVHCRPSQRWRKRALFSECRFDIQGAQCGQFDPSTSGELVSTSGQFDSRCVVLLARISNRIPICGLFSRQATPCKRKGGPEHDAYEIATLHYNEGSGYMT